MGKERHKRRKLHASAPKVKDAKKEEIPEPQKAKANFSLPILGENIFEGVNINADQLMTQTLPDFDARSTVTSKAFKGMNLSKKEKQKMRHEAWMKKIDALQMAKKEAKAKKKRQKTVIVGDLKPLEDTLPALELLLKGTKGQKHTQPEEKVTTKKAIKKESVRKKEMMEGINLFQQVLKHPDYKSNPGAAITEHLKNKLQQEEEMQS